MANYENVIPLTLMYEGGDTLPTLKKTKAAPQNGELVFYSFVEQMMKCLTLMVMVY